MKILVTGGAGFIGSAVIRHLVSQPGLSVVNLDKLTYAGNLASLASIETNPNYHFAKVDICDTAVVKALLEAHQPDAIMHLAAESHVDRSINDPSAFITTNVVGTYSLLECAHAYWLTLSGPAKSAFRFHHISTDEVFGSLGPEGLFSETSPYDPRSPYSASKAASDHFVSAWYHTYGLPVVTSNCSNNYGPYQFPEKLIPLIILNCLEGKALPVYGRGDNIRDWLFVEDHARALWTILQKGRIGETYNVGGNAERTNLSVVQAICDLVDGLVPGDKPRRELIRFVDDRPGHDARYAIDAGKISSELGWAAQESFETGLRKTVEWYLGSKDWWTDIRDNRYAGERLGLTAGRNV